MCINENAHAHGVNGEKKCKKIFLKNILDGFVMP